MTSVLCPKCNTRNTVGRVGTIRCGSCGFQGRIQGANGTNSRPKALSVAIIIQYVIGGLALLFGSAIGISAFVDCDSDCFSGFGGAILLIVLPFSLAMGVVMVWSGRALSQRKSWARIVAITTASLLVAMIASAVLEHISFATRGPGDLVGFALVSSLPMLVLLGAFVALIVALNRREVKEWLQ